MSKQGFKLVHLIPKNGLLAIRYEIEDMQFFDCDTVIHRSLKLYS